MEQEYRTRKLVVWLTKAEQNDVRDAAHDDPACDNVSDWIRGLIREAMAKRRKKGTDDAD
jgi:hypothetical protein